MKRMFSVCFLSLLLIFVFSGCLNTGLNYDPESSGRLNLYITDAVVPIDEIEHVYVNIKNISLYGGPVDNPVLQISDEQKVVDLFDLIGTELDLATVEGTGTYNQIRFEVSDATVTILSEDYTVEVKSATVKLNIPVDFSEDPEVLLDFDLSKSLKIQGKWDPEDPGELHMTPVVTARFGLAYDVSGIIVPHESIYLLALGDFENEENAETIFTTFTHCESNKWIEGEFRFPKIPQGDYILRIFNKDVYGLENFDILNDIPVKEIDVQMENADLNLGNIYIE